MTTCRCATTAPTLLSAHSSSNARRRCAAQSGDLCGARRVCRRWRADRHCPDRDTDCRALDTDDVVLSPMTSSRPKRSPQRPAPSPGPRPGHLPAGGEHALPGDVAPASPANIGHRVTALRRIRSLQAAADRAPSPASRAARHRRRLSGARQPSTAPCRPRSRRRDRDRQRLPMWLPGSRTMDPMTVLDRAGRRSRSRGEVIDIFPADAKAPAGASICSTARIAAIRWCDRRTQLSEESRDALEIGVPPSPSRWRPRSRSSRTGRRHHRVRAEGALRASASSILRGRACGQKAARRTPRSAEAWGAAPRQLAGGGTSRRPTRCRALPKAVRRSQALRGSPGAHLIGTAAPLVLVSSARDLQLRDEDQHEVARREIVEDIEAAGRGALAGWRSCSATIWPARRSPPGF